jgi:hypothetical protein
MPADRRAGDQTRETTMFTTMKTLAALTLGLSILATAPAMAALTENGLSQNGVWQNGMTMNGFSNGQFLNGHYMNGQYLNGRQADAHALRVIGIELPSEAVAR